MILRFFSIVLLWYLLGFLGFSVTLGSPAAAQHTDVVIAITGGPYRIERGVDVLSKGYAKRMLIAGGFSICGAAAVAAVDGVIQTDKDEEVVTAVALVVVFGTLMIPFVPFASSLLGFSSGEAGLWAGASTHEVAQVVAAGGVIGGGALAVAVIVKLARVLLLAPVMAVVGVAHRRRTGADASGKRPPLVPLFVLAFLIGANAFARMELAIINGSNVTRNVVLLLVILAGLRMASRLHREPLVDFDEGPDGFNQLGLHN